MEAQPIRIDAVKPVLLREHFEEIFQKKPVGAKQKLVDAVVAFYAQQNRESGMGLAVCDECGAATNQAFDNCPLCGCGELPMSTAAEPVVEDEPKAKKEKKEKPAKKEKSHKAELVAADKPPAEEYNEADLDNELTEFRNTQRSAATNYWHLGDHLARIRDKGLWRLRKGADDKPLYTSFEKFVKSEIGWSGKSATVAIQVALTFTAEDVERIGQSTLGFIVQLPEDLRETVLSEAEGKTLKEVKQLAGFGSKSPILGETEKKEPTPKAAVITLEKEETVLKMFTRKQPKSEDGSPSVYAKSVDEKPWCKVMSKGGVTVIATLRTTNNGHLELVLNTSREN